jgi:phosphoribosylformimino-5-aminoimidazole carboxamide ribotide isomerase
MIIFPAIDLKDGVCVRLKKGVMADATVFNTDPAAQAREFAAQGFQWLHCVDLNGAFAGHSANAEAIKSIRAAIDLPIQLGGGIRDMKAVEGWIAAGITRVILGTAALTDPQFVKDAARAFPGRIVVGADAKGGKIATQGWADVSDLTPTDLGRRFEDAGVAAILFTDIDGDGLLKGVNVAATAARSDHRNGQRAGEGGVGSIADIDNLVAANEPNITGVVVGRALYDGRIDVAEALKRARQL